MNKILSYYTKYAGHIDEYNEWQKYNEENNGKNTNLDAGVPLNSASLKQKANAIALPILVHDRYEHEKEEDAETFFQTLNIELMSIAGAISSIPIAITKIIPFLNKHSDKNSIIKTVSNILEKYKNTSFNIAGKNIPAAKTATVGCAAASALFYVNGIKNSMESELGIIRKADFDATQNIINDPKLFVILNDEQEEQINKTVENDNKSDSAFVDKLKDKVDINSSFKEAGLYKKTYKEYAKNKSEYMNTINAGCNKKMTVKQSEQAEEDKVLFENYLKNVEHDVLEPLRRIETIANISYSSLFIGGFLEYLISDKLVQVLG
ncbi:MAG: hypothetical protein LUH11_01780, partial [Candidatus Gastranaerophilales bacterium]|nr:hypothetical protein [Candidatus Gastranaerophilales bacterium]